ncbi:MAG: hypothetical protein ISS34_07400 [Candidatus Omnitrophica bacterium]|nr:hypothetical protein [Candidatus Omnitrophota bacterium]
MAYDKISPEERLFKVIQGGKAAPPHKAARRLGIRALALPVKFQIHELDIKVVNMALSFILIFLAIAVAYYAIYASPSVAKITEVASAVKPLLAKKADIENFKPMPYYLMEIDKRNIFQPAPKLNEKVISSRERTSMEELQEISGDFKLQGISWGKMPKVMIKSEKEDKIYFLKEGQMIGATNIKVEKIFNNKVIVSCEDAQMELL